MKRNSPRRCLVRTACCIVLAVMGAACAKRESDIIPRRKLFDNPVKAMPTISLDGTKMAYLAPLNGVLNIHIRTIGAEDDRPLTREAERGVKSYYWARNNSQILYVQDRTGMEDFHLYGADLSTGAIRDYTPHDGLIVGLVAASNRHPNSVLVSMNLEDARRSDVYLLDLSTGALSRIAENPGNIVRWYADTSLSVRGALATLPEGGSQLLVRSEEKDPWRVLRTWTFEEMAVSGPLRFTMDGAAMYCIDAVDANAGRLVSIALEDGGVTVIAEHPRFDVSAVWLDPKTHDVQAVFFAGERSERRVIDPRIQADMDELRRIDDGDFGLVNRDTADAVWIVSYLKDDGPVSYYAYDRRTKKATFLFYDKPELRNYELAPMKPISIAARDGLVLPAYITYPPGRGKKNLPLVLLVHGGLWHRDYWGFDAEAQWLANRGYACLQVNYRGSSGYGKSFANAGNREWGGKMQDDLVDAARWAIEEGIADPDRIAIFGASYGGFAVLTALSDTPDMFCCGVEVGGVIDLVKWLTSLPDYAVPYKAELFRRVGDPHAEADMLAARSPAAKADMIRSPLMLVHGGLDRTSPPEDAERLAAALRSRDIPHEYLLFPDEGHTISKPKNKLQMYEAAERFLARYLGGRVEEPSER